jgi:hypothetical protein
VIIIYSLGAPKSIRETEKTLKTLSSGQKKTKKTKKPKKTQKKPKKPKKPTGLGFLKKTRVFSNPESKHISENSNGSGSTEFPDPAPSWAKGLVPD